MRKCQLLCFRTLASWLNVFLSCTTFNLTVSRVSFAVNMGPLLSGGCVSVAGDRRIALGVHLWASRWRYSTNDRNKKAVARSSRYRRDYPE